MGVLYAGGNIGKEINDAYNMRDAVCIKNVML